SVWYDIFQWLGVVLVVPHHLFVLFDCLSGYARSKKGFRLIWQTTLWMIWKTRNEEIFANGVKFIKAVVDEIKVMSWRRLCSTAVACSLLVVFCLQFAVVWLCLGVG
ncbi:resistance-like protein, partial [Trifolium medium]|nr:resistance-like protein [Trifolium medium]